MGRRSESPEDKKSREIMEDFHNKFTYTKQIDGFRHFLWFSYSKCVIIFICKGIDDNVRYL